MCVPDWSSTWTWDGSTDDAPSRVDAEVSEVVVDVTNAVAEPAAPTGSAPGIFSSIASTTAPSATSAMPAITRFARVRLGGGGAAGVKRGSIWTGASDSIGAADTFCEAVEPRSVAIDGVSWAERLARAITARTSPRSFSNMPPTRQPSRRRAATTDSERKPSSSSRSSPAVA